MLYQATAWHLRPERSVRTVHVGIFMDRSGLFQWALRVSCLFGHVPGACRVCLDGLRMWDSVVMVGAEAGAGVHCKCQKNYLNSTLIYCGCNWILLNHCLSYYYPTNHLVFVFFLDVTEILKSIPILFKETISFLFHVYVKYVYVVSNCLYYLLNIHKYISQKHTHTYIGISIEYYPWIFLI